MRRTLSFVIGAAIGGLIGAAAALLLAPSSGKEFRFMISDRTQSLMTDIRQATNSKRIELQQRLETLKSPKG